MEGKLDQAKCTDRSSLGRYSAFNVAAWRMRKDSNSLAG